MTIFYEGGRVNWLGDESAEGHIVSLASTSAHVKWASGPDEGQITFIDLYDIEPVTASVQKDPMHLTAVRTAYDNEQEVGVLNFLASHKYTSSWEKIALDVLAFVQERIRADASMDLVEEQLSVPERDKVVHAAAAALLRDAFGTEE